MSAPRWRGRLARGAYSTLLSLLEPLYLLRLWRRGRREPLYRHAIPERLGRYRDQPEGHGWVWVHAVSLGETRAAAALIEALRARLPSMRLLLTHGTATGREAGAALLRPGDAQAWLPYDTPRVVERFFARFRPAVGVLMETEVWPNLLHAAARHRVPMVLANARLSEKSQRQGQRIAAVIRPAVRTIALVLAQSEADAARLRSAGAAEVRVTGNLKFDMSPDAALREQGAAWRAAGARPVVMLAATREGEEASLLAAWQRHLGDAHGPRPLLLVVPRHPQRFDEVGVSVQGLGLTLSRRSGWAAGPSAADWQADVWLGDSMGEMPLYYALSDVSLLGGSFAPLGGQNLIEAAACGCPLVMGPHTFNFAEAASLALQSGAAMRVPDEEAGVAAAMNLLEDRPAREAMSQRAAEFAARHRGAAARMAEAIAPFAQAHGVRRA